MLQKFATAQILESDWGRIPVPSLKKSAHRAVFDYTPQPGMLYVRSRMISSRCNDNFDEFPAEEIEKGYHTFIGKPVFVNHNNEDHRVMRGLIRQVALHRDHNPDGSPDTWVEGLMEVDAMSFPVLAKAIILGDIDRTSMGVDVDFSICAVCHNKATTPLSYCQHIPGMKGKRYSRFVGGTPQTMLIRERCYGLRFFENSLLVEDPADPTAYTLGKPVLGPGLDHLEALLRTEAGTAARTAAMLPMRGDQIQVTGHLAASWQQANPVTPRLRTVASARSTPVVEGIRCEGCGGRQTLAVGPSVDCLECGHLGGFVQGQLHEAVGPKYPDPADHPWFQQHPVNHDSIVQHWDAATEDEKNSGRRWYPDAHLVAHALATLHPDYKKSQHQKFVHMAAGVLANYSPQTGWESNQHNAARALHSGKGIGGPGSGVFASNHQKNAADKIMSGQPYTDVLGGPKVQDFAHLIEHGGDAANTHPHVVVDRHALSVAVGKRMSENDYDAFPKTQRHYYGHVAQAYNDAAHQIGDRDGETLAGHQVQATTWLVRQRFNQAEESERAKGGVDSPLDRGRARTRQKNSGEWEDFRRHHLPNLEAHPGTGYTATRRRAYNETKAPADVDTLRDEECPVCGDADAWDGNTCKVCGFIAPPKEFQDPDTSVARQLDLRKDDADLDGTDVGQLNDSINDVDRDGVDDQTGELMNEDQGDVQPGLVCPACGTEFEAGEPLTTNMDNPQAGATGDGPAEGDVCPVCAKGLLEEPQALGMQDPDDEESGAQAAKPSAQEPEDDEEPGVEDEDEGAATEQPSDENPDPDNDGDDDRTPEGDTDHDFNQPPAKKKSKPKKK